MVEALLVMRLTASRRLLLSDTMAARASISLALMNWPRASAWATTLVKASNMLVLL